MYAKARKTHYGTKERARGPAKTLQTFLPLTVARLRFHQRIKPPPAFQTFKGPLLWVGGAGRVEECEVSKEDWCGVWGEEEKVGRRYGNELHFEWRDNKVQWWSFVSQNCGGMTGKVGFQLWLVVCFDARTVRCCIKRPANLFCGWRFTADMIDEHDHYMLSVNVSWACTLRWNQATH